MNISDLRKMSWEELRAHREDVDSILKEKETKRRNEAIEAARQAARGFGVSIDELFSGSPATSTKGETKRKRVSTKPPIRHPENPSLTWGRLGKMPKWLVELIDNGHKIEDLEIK